MVAAIYVATGRLGLVLAVPPGFATAIFPPAGIAVAALLMRGPVSLPGIYLGSFLLNSWIGYGVTSGNPLLVMVAAGVIAAASTLQAAVAVAALRRAIGYPMALDTGQDLLCFLLLSPVCCLTSATLSLAGLWALDVVPDSALLSNWVTWWVGDTLGVLVVLPLMLVLAGEPRPLWRSRRRPVALPMLLFFGFFVAVFIRVSAWENEQSLLEFRLRSQETVDRIRTRLEEAEVFLEQLERSFSGDTALSRTDFSTLVRSALYRFSTVSAVEWAPRVKEADRASFEAAQQAQIPSFVIRDIQPDAAPRRAGTRVEYYPVTYIEPRGVNDQAFGVDLLANRDRAATIATAIDTGAVTTGGLARPIGKPELQNVVLLMLAVPGGSNGSGLLVVVLRVGDFVKGLLSTVNESLDLRLVDLAGGQVLYDNFATSPGRSAYTQTFAFGQRRYEVQTIPTASYLKQHRGWQSWALLAVGVLGTGLLGALLMLGTGYTNRIERQVEERTGDLAAANRQLRIEIDQRRDAEAALRHAQRMEAIGQLTGGIAHDFNNLLTVISANAELIRNDAKDEAGLRRSGGILRATERGERLTRQLLAFSRRQMLRPEVVDLRQRATEMAEMLSRSTRADIEVVVDLPEGLWPVAIDPAEFELAILNIAVNARDAMPRGGRFHVGAANATIRPEQSLAEGITGEFVALTLSDTGDGMAPDVLARAFEPYFTTKDVGAGSGLGLSQVYGFATQSGGDATIASRPGEGTMVTLFLPRAVAALAIVKPEAPPPVPAPPVKILVVEDEAEIAELTVAMLRELGYEAIHVQDAAGALAVLASDPAIGLVVTDIVMPGATSGLELALGLREQRPHLPVLLVTGYSQYGREMLGTELELLEKPYRRETLAEAVRAAIGGHARSSALSRPG